jgi:hypothetical protein
MPTISINTSYSHTSVNTASCYLRRPSYIFVLKSGAQSNTGFRYQVMNVEALEWANDRVSRLCLSPNRMRSDSPACDQAALF